MFSYNFFLDFSFPLFSFSCIYLSFIFHVVWSFSVFLLFVSHFPFPAISIPCYVVSHFPLPSFSTPAFLSFIFLSCIFQLQIFVHHFPFFHCLFLLFQSPQRRQHSFIINNNNWTMSQGFNVETVSSSRRFSQFIRVVSNFIPVVSISFTIRGVGSEREGDR